jgi:hypothetical protein
MKKLSFFSLIICLLLLAGTVNATGLRTDFSKFEVTPVEDLFMGKNIQKIWTISYSSNETPVTVLKRKTSEGILYEVHAKFFDVCYAATSNGFGVKKIGNANRNVPKKISKAVLNSEMMKCQQIITPNKVDDETAIGLIASFLPELVNDGYTHVLN